ncbi:hypothetical protein NUU61_002048 [Penicillium alfredii]|uniref:chitinase n=1 Tax=Penicillium alfredii TaxID=1506179 RepID=A0A9W9KG95_9EURO|nr:uncharacterized protein NUU61_002048 [Penicillium alfredii]KAJ5104701.1 hypothetical protein NUU61_002048 [Penicillium alfredii]
MEVSNIFYMATALGVVVPVASALDINSKNNVAVYYASLQPLTISGNNANPSNQGQGANQPRLSHFCQETSIDIINLGFINFFPLAVSEWPGSNFGNQYNRTFYPDTELLEECPQLWEDIPICKAMGKTIMLSIGGVNSTDQDALADENAIWFADFLWYSFGPYNPSVKVFFPRPFGNAPVDGFDFDIENNGGSGYATMINQLSLLYTQYPDQIFYISGAPQYDIPDKQLGNAIANAALDFIWVQFYNTQGCSARDFVHGTGHYNYAEWVDVLKNSKNPSARLFVGLAAAESAAKDGYYLSPLEVKTLCCCSLTYINARYKCDTYAKYLYLEIPFEFISFFRDNSNIEHLEYFFESLTYKCTALFFVGYFHVSCISPTQLYNPLQPARFFQHAC